MIEITKEYLDQLVKEYTEREGRPPEGLIKDMEHYIGLHIDEKEANKFFDACHDFYRDAYDEGYEDG